jgi:hypothetical protein
MMANGRKYLIFEGYCYWVEWPVLNRALISTLDPVPEERKRG